MPLVRNCQPGPTVVQDPTSKQVVHWAGSGDSMGDDVQEISPEMMTNPGLVRALRRGVLQEITEDEISPTFFGDQAKAKLAIEQDEIAGVMAQVANPDGLADLVPVKCLISGEDLMISLKDLQERPPLAPRFASRADEFLPIHDGKLGSDGKPLVTWQKVTIGDALPSQA